MINYEGSIWRPPSEARSLILQATVGCSYNACIFCVSYKQKQFHIRGSKGLDFDLAQLPSQYKKQVRRVFLADGNALTMGMKDWSDSLKLLNEQLPNLERVSTYGYAKDVRDKSLEDLKYLLKNGLSLIYLGLETGDNELLRWCRKGITNQENIDVCHKIRTAGIPLSLTIILGLGGKENSERHAIETAKTLNTIDPEYVGALTLMTPSGTPIHDKVKNGSFKPMEPFDILKELRILIENLELSNCIFRTNHASNYLPIKGTLSKDKDQLLDVIDSAIKSGDEEILRPHYLRGL